MTRRKIVFVIVEGPSDDTALELIFSRLYDKNLVYVEILHEDITTNLKVKPDNIVSVLGNLIKDYAKKNHFVKSDFQEVIQIIDLDGAYVPDDAIVEDPLAEKPVYSIIEIRTARPGQLRMRNQRKRENIERLCFLNKIWSDIPYKAYYMSSNLDHVLYNKLNSTDNEKETDAHRFARKYKDDLKGFLDFMICSDFSVCGDFRKSWVYIKEGKRSLERHSNLGIAFQKMNGFNSDEQDNF